MTTMQEAVSRAYQRGIEVGRAAAKHEMDEFAILTAAVDEHVANVQLVGSSARKVVKIVHAKRPMTTRAPRKAAGPKTKGVKDTIMRLIAEDALTAAEIVARTGFKVTSVRATLMSLKAAKLAMSDENHRWYGSAERFDQTRAMIEGNSETEARV